MTNPLFPYSVKEISFFSAHKNYIGSIVYLYASQWVKSAMQVDLTTFDNKTGHQYFKKCIQMAPLCVHALSTVKTATLR